jgi:hypothetical protein
MFAAFLRLGMTEVLIVLCVALVLGLASSFLWTLIRSR